ncbi:unnamed protein product [Ectocarpus sp. CCAP 1310/34]|nr:unnamed protein product [Ectocarpus sp. CCAP 1310/34]
MFYNMFLDEDVRSSLSEYDALSIIEWDVLVASDNSFEELYHAAFRVNEEFWVKGSNLEGTSFHSTAEASEMWQVLGHINGNAIYNNDDPAFVEYVEYTRARWGYEHPYDVALWMTISDFPYSWPLYQRYSSKFVVTNLVGNVASFRATAAAAVALKKPEPAQQSSRKLTSVPKWKKAEKWRNGNDDGTPKWKRNQKWKNKDGGSEPKWRTNQKWKNRNDSSDDSSSSDESCSSRCAYTSKDGTKGRVCDSNCSSPNVYGTKGCNAKQGIYGADCRVCYNSVDKALKQDSPDNRAIMYDAVVVCSTVMPVDVYHRRMSAADEGEASRVARRLAALKEDASSPAEEVELAVKVDQDRKLTSVPRWKAKEKWRTANDDGIPKWQRNQKWKTKKDDGGEPKWRTNQKWKNKNGSSDDSSSSDPGCSSRCTYTSKDGTKGRVCDSNCSTPNVYGTKGCGAKQGIYGADCRVCYNNVDRALKQDSPDNRAIMCSTMMPVDVYGRRLSASDEGDPLRVAKMIEAEEVGDEWSVDVDRVKAIRFFEEAAERPFFQDLKRHNLCAFVGGRVGEEAMWEVTVKSILQFMPGMRVAIAAESEGLDAYERSLGGLPGAAISSTQNSATAALFADQYCGAGTALILYVEPGSVLSRPFTSKDTHSPRGDLLVVHTGSPGSYHDSQLRSRSASVLGFDAPSFTHGTDLMLPMGTNQALRESLGFRLGASLQHDGDGASLIALEELVGFDRVSALPQVLAALAYSRETPGVWFVDPQAWVGQNLFKEASIWDVPLVKPRYMCAIAPAQLEPGSPNTANVLQSNLDFFSKGGKCANGLIDIMP